MISTRWKYKARKRNKGIAVVEFAAVAAVFFALLFTLIDVALYGFVKLTMQHAVREGARYAITGSSTLDPNPDPDSGASRKAAVIYKITQSSTGLLDKVMDVDKIRVEDINGNSVADFGAPGQLISIHLDCEWTAVSPIMYPLLEDGKYKFTVSASMRNEAF